MGAPPASARGRAIATAVTASAQIAVLLAAAVLGVLIGRRFGSTAATDGFFTANAIYGVVLFVGQSLRTTTVARMIEGEPRMDRFRAQLDAVALLAVVSTAGFALAVLAAPAVVEPGAEAVFRSAMLVFIPVAALHLFTGLAAAMIAAYGGYTPAALAYGAGAAVSVLAFFVWTPPFGVEGIPVALATGSIVTTGLLAAMLARHGWRPSLPRAGPTARRDAARIMLAAASIVAGQIILAISVAFAGGVEGGGATIYTYAMMIMLGLTAGLVSPIGVVFAPIVAREWDRDPVTLVPLTMRAFRVGLMLLPPAVALAVLLGRAPAEAVLTRVSAADVEEIFDLALALSPSLIAALLGVIPLLAVFTAGGLRPLAALAAIVTLAHAGASALTVALGGGLTALALVGTGASVVIAFAAVAVAFRRHAGAVLARAAVATATIAVPGALLFGLAAAFAQPGDGFAGALVASAVGLAAYAAFLGLAHRLELRELARLLRR